MDLLSVVASGGGVSAIVIFGVLGMALTVFIAGAALALKANRSAQDSRLALADAEVKLAAAGDLASEVRELRSRVEEAVIHHNDAVSNARYQHNEACAPQTAYAASDAPAQHAHDDGHDHGHAFKGKHDDDHKKHHSAGFKKPDDDHKKHHSAGYASGLKGGKHDDDHKKHHSGAFKGKHDDDHKKHHRGDEEREHTGFMGWFFDR